MKGLCLTLKNTQQADPQEENKKLSLIQLKQKASADVLNVRKMKNRGMSEAFTNQCLTWGLFSVVCRHILHSHHPH